MPRDLMRILFFLALYHSAGLYLLPPTALAAELNDPTLRFSLTIPDGFAPDAAITRFNPDFSHGFRRPAPDGGPIDTIIIIERMRGVIGRERLDRSKLPAGFRGRVLTARWHGFDVDAIEILENEGGVDTLTINTQVPLKPEAVQVRVVGPAGDAEQLRAFQQKLLSGLRGESNWLQSAAPAGVAASPHYGTMLVVLILVGVVTAITTLVLLRRRLPRGGLLVLSIAIYAGSWTMGLGVTREGRAAVGAVRMVGFFGALFGLYDLARRRTPQTKPTPSGTA